MGEHAKALGFEAMANAVSQDGVAEDAAAEGDGVQVGFARGTRCESCKAVGERVVKETGKLRHGLGTIEAGKKSKGQWTVIKLDEVASVIERQKICGVGMWRVGAA